MTESDIPRCVACGNEMPGRTRRARWCSATCKMRVRRGAPLQVVADPEDEGPVTSAVRAQLVGVGRLETVDGQLALLMARRFESNEGTAAALASLSRELRRTLELALEGTTTHEPDFIDELHTRRLRKITKATSKGPTR